jgi:Fe-S-cluster containining protein
MTTPPATTADPAVQPASAAGPLKAEIPAGAFGDWLERFRASLVGDQGSDVPCGECTGCCISGYSVQVRPEDNRARARIPAELLISALGLARGERTLAARADGTCPMLSDRTCTIYQDRPQTCRDYDCRVFAAARMEAGGIDKEVINRRVRQWRFTYPSESDRNAHDAVAAAATFIRQKRSSFPGQLAPTGPTGVAVLACESYSVFLLTRIGEMSDGEIARAMLDASRELHRRS